jgi:transposase
MTWRPQPLPAVPETTAAAVRAAFPTGNLYVDLRTAFGTRDDDQLFADLDAEHGRPVEVAPWRWALGMVRLSIEGLTERQAADAVRRGLDWKSARSLELTAPGVDFTLLPDCRDRLLTHEAAQRLLDTGLLACNARGWINARGTQRPDSTHVLAAVRTLHRSHACWTPCVKPSRCRPSRSHDASDDDAGHQARGCPGPRHPTRLSRS